MCVDTHRLLVRPQMRLSRLVLKNICCTCMHQRKVVSPVGPLYRHCLLWTKCKFATEVPAKKKTTVCSLTATICGDIKCHRWIDFAKHAAIEDVVLIILIDILVSTLSIVDPRRSVQLVLSGDEHACAT